jgi:putative nucleotidyltransferase with HDIG domain
MPLESISLLMDEQKKIRLFFEYSDSKLSNSKIKICLQGDSMTRDEALTLVREYVKAESLVRHMLSVEAAMRFYAEKFGEDVEAWGFLGLIHDFDWEIHPTLEEHPTAGAAILREHGVPEDIIQDILSHADHTGVPRDTLRRKALYACDEITGFVTAVALVRPRVRCMTWSRVRLRRNGKTKPSPLARSVSTSRPPPPSSALTNGNMSATSLRPCGASRLSWGWWGIFLHNNP